METRIGQGTIFGVRVSWVLLAWLPFAILAAFHWADLPFREAGDYAQYILHAKAITEGRPYGDIGYIFTPFNALIGPRAQPPGWPLMLAPVVAVFGTGLLVPKVLVTLLGLAFLTFAAVRLARTDAVWIGVASAAATGAALESSLATNSPLSDLPFAALLWGVLLIADSEQRLSWPRVIAIGILGTFAISVRVVGVAIVPAIFLLALVRPRDRQRLLTLVAVWAGLAIVATAIVGLDQVPFLKLAMRGPEVLLGRVLTLWHKYQYGLFEALTYPTPWDIVNDLFHAAALLLLPLGAWEFFRRFGRSALGCVVVVYGVMLAVSPVADLRYLWPLTPVITYMLFAAIRRLLEFIKGLGERSTRLTAGVAIVLIAGAVLTSLSKPSKPSLLDRPDVQDLFSWATRTSRSEEMRVLFEAPRVLTLETGIPAMGYFRATPEQTRHEITRGRITHLVVAIDAPEGLVPENVRSLPSDGNSEFQQVYANQGYKVYRVRLALPGS